MKTLRQKINSLDKKLTALEEYTADQQNKLRNALRSMQVIVVLMTTGFFCGFIYSYRKSLKILLTGVISLVARVYTNYSLFHKLNIF